MHAVISWRSAGDSTDRPATTRVQAMSSVDWWLVPRWL